MVGEERETNRTHTNLEQRVNTPFRFMTDQDIYALPESLDRHGLATLEEAAV